MKQTRRIMHALGLAATEAIIADALQIKASGGMPIVSVRPHLSPKQQRTIIPALLPTRRRFPPMAHRPPQQISAAVDQVGASGIPHRQSPTNEWKGPL